MEHNSALASTAFSASLALLAACSLASCGGPSVAKAGPDGSAIEQVKAASADWIASFNRGDVDGCVAAYHSDALMEAQPMGSFRGTAAIDGFWRPFIASGASDLVYRNVRLEQVDERTVTLAAEWSMNVGRGVITEERWVRQDDGVWRLTFDAFEVQERFQPQ